MAHNRSFQALEVEAGHGMIPSMTPTTKEGTQAKVLGLETKGSIDEERGIEEDIVIKTNNYRCIT